MIGYTAYWHFSYACLVLATSIPLHTVHPHISMVDKTPVIDIDWEESIDEHMNHGTRVAPDWPSSPLVMLFIHISYYSWIGSEWLYSPWTMMMASSSPLGAVCQSHLSREICTLTRSAPIIEQNTTQRFLHTVKPFSPATRVSHKNRYHASLHTHFTADISLIQAILLRHTFLFIISFSSFSFSWCWNYLRYPPEGKSPSHSAQSQNFLRRREFTHFLQWKLVEETKQANMSSLKLHTAVSQSMNSCVEGSHHRLSPDQEGKGWSLLVSLSCDGRQIHGWMRHRYLRLRILINRKEQGF